MNNQERMQRMAYIESECTRAIAYWNAQSFPSANVFDIYFRQRYPLAPDVDLNSYYTSDITDRLCNSLHGHYNFSTPYYGKSAAPLSIFKECLHAIGVFLLHAQDLYVTVAPEINFEEQYPFASTIRKWLQINQISPSLWKHQRIEFYFIDEEITGSLLTKHPVCINQDFVSHYFPCVPRHWTGNVDSGVYQTIEKYRPRYIVAPSLYSLMENTCSTYHAVLDFLMQASTLEQLALANHRQQLWIATDGKIIKARGDSFYPT